ncbi:unnamed protein product [Prorocentrum cordatum]|uniref:Uncharacterized protein n=1 Tax=Prorocentrum cordatum TaxID=2364126 RepID=A0ABN9XFV6_9DINO|nr:unnamed protein product [Polarella glacialis]
MWQQRAPTSLSPEAHLGCRCRGRANCETRRHAAASQCLCLPWRPPPRATTSSAPLSLPAARSSDACTARQRRQRAQEDPNQGHSAGRRLVVSGYGGLRTGPTAKPRRWPQCGARARAHGAGEAQDGGAVQKRRPGRPRRLCSSGTNLTNHDAAALGAQGRAATRERKATLLRAEGPARGPRRPLGKFACEGPSAAASWGSKRHRYRRV